MRPDLPHQASSTRRNTRLVRWAAANPVIAALAIAGLAGAAITVTYTTASTLSTGVTPPPIQFALGDDTGALTDYVTAMTISANKTYLTTSVKGVPEATLSVGSFFKIQNVDDVSHAITLSTSNVTNSLVSAYTLQILSDTGSLVDAIDLRGSSGTVSASANIPAGTTYSVKLTLALASTAGANNVDLSNALTLSFA